jgi:hypothetical protein
MHRTAATAPPARSRPTRRGRSALVGLCAVPVAFGVLACTNPQPQERTPRGEAETPPAATAPPSTDAPAAEAADRDAFVPQTTLARWLTDAAQRDEAAVLQHALTELGRGLASYRTGWDPALLVAMRVVSAPSVAESLQRIDDRFLPPLVEGLLDGRDWAGVVRVTEGRDAGPARSFLGPARTRAQSDPRGTLSVDGCGPASATEVLAGTHELTCDDAVVLVFVLESETVSVRWTDGEVEVEPAHLRIPAPPAPAPRDADEAARPPSPGRWR